jgi:hypothetical protein
MTGDDTDFDEVRDRGVGIDEGSDFFGEVVIATGVDIVLGDGIEVSSVFFGVGFSCLLEFLGLFAGEIMDCF